MIIMLCLPTFLLSVIVSCFDGGRGGGGGGDDVAALFRTSLFSEESRKRKTKSTNKKVVPRGPHFDRRLLIPARKPIFLNKKIIDYIDLTQHSAAWCEVF